MNDETLLISELTRRADDVVAPPLTFETVRGRAHGIRRRRRAAATAAVAAVVALAIVVPTVLGGGPDRSDRIDPAPEPRSGPAAVLHEGSITLPGGGTIPLDINNRRVSAFAVLEDGRIAVARNQPSALQVYSAAGELAAEYPIGDTYLVASADSGTVAWMERNGGVMVLASGESEPIELGTVKTGEFTYPMIDAVLDAGHVLVGDGNTTTTEVTADGNRKLQTVEPLRVRDVSPEGDLWAVQYADDADPQYGCSGLYDPATDQFTARSCEISNLSFSPDGEHLLSGFYENNMAGEVTIVDRKLETVGTYSPAPNVVSRAGWADDEHVIAAVSSLEDNQWSLVRVGLDGLEPSVVAGPYAGRNPETFNDFLLSE